LPHNWGYRRWYRCLKRSVTQGGQHDPRQHTGVHRGHTRPLPTSCQEREGRRYKKGLFNRYQKIKLTLENIQVSRKGEKATVSFKQYFQTERYKDKGLKTLDLEKENGEWKIVQETWEKLSD